MRLLLDLGNSRLKWALQGPSPAWLAQGLLEWREDLATLPDAAWAGFPRSTQVVGASVVDEAREQRVAAVLRQAFDSAPEWLRTPASACGVRNAYAEPQRLGIELVNCYQAAKGAGLI